MVIARIGRRVAHLLGWHTPACLLPTASPRRMSRPGCEPPAGMVARVSWWSGWHRWVPAEQRGRALQVEQALARASAQEADDGDGWETTAAVLAHEVLRLRRSSGRRADR